MLLCASVPCTYCTYVEPAGMHVVSVCRQASYHGNMACSTRVPPVRFLYAALHRDLGCAELAPRGVWRRPLFEFASKVHAAAAVSWPHPHLTKYLFIQIRSDLAKRRILYKHDPWTNVTGPAGCRRCSNPSAGPAPCLHPGAH